MLDAEVISTFAEWDYDSFGVERSWWKNTTANGSTPQLGRRIRIKQQQPYSRFLSSRHTNYDDAGRTD
jgi:hypothetical protein